ncbi:MAG: hypothetical protein OXG51_07950 [Gammaproteobacteria bacterium]|nr:hypothetical protein [Gammaproteobacteria bacterium]
MSQPDPLPDPSFVSDPEILIKWVAYMDRYGQRWLDDIGKDYFSQEYWYLFTVTLVHHWRGTPLSISEACDCMKTGSSKTRQNRLQKLITEHLFFKTKDRADLRRTHLEPTEEMLDGGRMHFRGTLTEATRFLDEAGLLPSSPQPLLDEISHDSDAVDRRFLLPWAEFLVNYTNDWNTTFNKLFHTEEYWYTFVHSLLGIWKGQPLTMSDACQSMRTGSSRTKEKRVSLAVTRGMLLKQKSPDDMRITHVLASSTLEELLIGHFERTLGDLLKLTKRLFQELDQVLA